MTGDAVRRPFWVLALLIGSATIGMHIFVPALPQLIEEFRIDTGQAQLTISLYMFIIAGGQLVYGPLSDRFGRRPVLLGALGLFTLAGLAAMLAQSFDALLLARMAQAAGGCAGLVLGRAVVHDTAQGTDAARTIAAVNSVLLISPTLAPVVGVWIASTFGWRGIALLLSLLGLVTMAGVSFGLTETAASRAEPMRRILRKYLALIRSRPFLLQVIGGSLVTTTMFVLLTASPFVAMERLGRSLNDAMIFYSIFVLGLLMGNLQSGRVLRRFGFARTFVIMSGVGLTGALIFLGAVTWDVLTVPVFVVAGFLYTLMAGTMAPLTLTYAVGLSPDLRGSATGIFGASQFTVGAIGVTVAGFGSDIVQLAAVVLVCCAGMAFALYSALLLRERRVAV
ncbi:MFS transporter [Paracoccus sp. S-4012]|uniref:MFS transporter n=1 Tax=Paracoccus sp. S-4012 TaxID=2665648 RepID=UPI0012B025D9|nr:MFS transporter [Paracoccus sp. S-4012]MRX48918.1 MFS transporter [Paracoccus sp. S-4012]